MKLTYKNLDTISLAKNGNFRKNTTYFVYKDSCKTCGEPYLDHKKRPSDYCCSSCYHNNRSDTHNDRLKINHVHLMGKDNPMYGKRFFGENNPNYRGGYHTNNLAAYNTYSKQLQPIEETRRSPKDKGVLETKCVYCSKWFIPKLTAVQDRLKFIKGINKNVEGKLYCSDNCRTACPTYNKHKLPNNNKPATSREVQPQLRKLVLERDNWMCQKCGSTDSELHCHHIDPVINNPVESADVDNCITLCKDCHIKIHGLTGCAYHELRCT